MKVWIQIASIIAVASVGSLIYVALFTPQLVLIHWLNALFIVSLIIIACSAGTVFLYSPPFQRVAYNFTYFFSKLKKENKVADDVERKNKGYKGDDLKEIDRPRWTTSFLIAGIFLGVVSTLFSVISSS